MTFFSDYSSSYNPTSTTHNNELNDYQSTFYKYSKGNHSTENNLEDNLEMKYSMTQDLYDNKR